MAKGTSDKIILYDLDTNLRPRECWSMNCWKGRLCLNYKGLEYDTSWLEFPDIEPTFKSYGIEPISSNMLPYTTPAIRLPNQEYVMDSLNIARRLNTLYPEPALPIDTPHLKRVEDLVYQVMISSAGIMLGEVLHVMNQRSSDYYQKSREEMLQMPIAEFVRQNHSTAIEKSHQALKEMADLYREHPEGPFLLGEQVSFADFMVVGFFGELLALPNCQYDEFIEPEKEIWTSLMEACAPWMQKKGD